MKPPPEIPNDLLDVKEAAALTKVHPETVKKWVYQGRLRHFRVGTRIRISKRDLEAFAAACQSGREIRA